MRSFFLVKRDAVYSTLEVQVNSVSVSVSNCDRKTLKCKFCTLKDWTHGVIDLLL